MPDEDPYQPLEEEDEWIGYEEELVPKIPAGDKCNSKKSETFKKEDGFKMTMFTGYCKNPAGKGTDHLGEGRCKFHGGCSTGAPDHNQHGATTGLSADPHHYSQSLPDEEREFVDGSAAAIEDRLRALKGDVDFLDRILCQRIAIRLHMVAKASDYINNVSGLTQIVVHGEGASEEKKAALVEEVRRFDNSILRDLKTLGVLNDPESKKADALSDWRSFVDQGKEEETVIDVEEIE